jgi:DNA-binding GntR family transcriptional regulator
LEGAAARLAARKINLGRLENFGKQFLSYKKNSDDYKVSKINPEDYSFVDLGRKFHFFIVESAENNWLKELIKNIYDHLNMSRTFSYNRRRKEAIDEHMKILNALKNRNGEKSQTYMEEHLRNAFDMLIRLL